MPTENERLLKNGIAEGSGMAIGCMLPLVIPGVFLTLFLSSWRLSIPDGKRMSIHFEWKDAKADELQPVPVDAKSLPCPASKE